MNALLPFNLYAEDILLFTSLNLVKCIHILVYYAYAYTYVTEICNIFEHVAVQSFHSL